MAFQWNDRSQSEVQRDSLWCIAVRDFVRLSFGLLCLLLAGSACNRSQPYLVTSPTGLLTLATPATGGVGAANPIALGPPPTTRVIGTDASVAQMAELERRAKSLDENNRQLYAQLAQAQQQSQLFKERSDLMQRQLQDVSGQLQEARIASSRTTSPAAPALIATAPPSTATPATAPAKSSTVDSARKSGARLTANTSIRLNTDALRDLGYDVEVLGGIVRLRIPSDQIFQSSTDQLSPSGSGILDRVAEVIRRDYPRQRIAIEGHTDNAPLYGGNFATNHQLASAQTNAIYEHLTRRSELPAAQWFTLAHGANYPLQENQNPVGRAANRRIEFVIYPESF